MRISSVPSPTPRGPVRRFGPARTVPPVVLVLIALGSGVTACGTDPLPTGNDHLHETGVDFPAYVRGEIRLRIEGAQAGEYRQSGWFFLEEGRSSGPAAEQWGGFYSNTDRRGVAVDTLVQLLGWGPLPEGRRTIRPIRLRSSSETAPFAALSPFLYSEPVSFTFLPLNFHLPDAPLVYVTTDGSYIDFETIELPAIEPLISRGYGGRIQARLKMKMRGYRPLRTDSGMQFLVTDSYIEILGSLDLPVVRDDLGGGDPGG